MNNLFAMFAKKKFKKSLNIIHKRMRFSRFSIFDQTQITSYFKSVSQSFNSIKFNAFSSSFCSTSRICFSVNSAAKIPQYQNVAINETSNQQRFKAFEIQSFCTFQQEYMTAADVDHINKNIRVRTPLQKTRKYNLIISSIKSLIKSVKSFKIAVFISCFSSALRISLSVNHDSITPQILLAISSLLQVLRALIKQLTRVFAAFEQRYIAVADALIKI